MSSIIRTFALVTMLLGSSVAAYATASDHSSNRNTLRIEKDKKDKKDKDKYKDNRIDGSRVPVSVPDGDPSITLLLAMGAVGLLALRQRTAQKS